MHRRRALGLLLGSSAGVALGARGTGTEECGKDVEFLLAELQRQAGHFFAVKGIDWAAVGEQFRREAKEVKDELAHVKLCNRLVARLRDAHAGLMDLKLEFPDEAQGRRWTGPGVHLIAIGERVLVRQAFGAAREAGLSQGTQVEKIDGFPAPRWLEQAVERASDRRGYSTAQMALYEACHAGLGDWEGTKIGLDVVREGAPTHVELVRSGGPNYVPLGPIFPPKELQTLGRQRFGRTAAGFGYIHLRDVLEELPEQLDKMLPTLGDAPGLILDTRANGGGGCDHEAVFGRFIPAGKRWRQYRGAGGQPFTRSMVVIVDAGVRSAGETVAGMFKEDGRALMIGDTPTAGMSSQKTVITVPSGLFSVRFSVASNKGRFNGGRGIEGIGVPPHEVTPYEPADLAGGVDTQIRRAEEFLKLGLPKERIPWENIG
jgi:carboxyl-terminal processing protease